MNTSDIYTKLAKSGKLKFEIAKQIYSILLLLE